MENCDFEEYRFSPYSLILNKIAKQQRIPLNVQFELTPRCNFNCQMCYIHMTESHMVKFGSELSDADWLRIAAEAKNAGTLMLTLTGGEIFLRPDFRFIYEELSQMGFLIQLMTNASLITEETMEWLAKTPPYCIKVTLYGSNNEVYKSVCGIQNGFSRTDKAISLLQKANIPLYLTTTLIKNNEDDLSNMVNYAARKKLPFKYTYAVNKPVRGAISKAESVRRTLDTLPNRTYNFDKNKIVPYRHHSNLLNDCGSYGSGFVVTWNGLMTMCAFMDQPVVDLTKYDVSSAWSSLLDQLSLITKPEECNNCRYEDYCKRCPGILNAECGAYNKTTREFCNRAKFLYDLYNGGVNNEESFHKTIIAPHRIAF